jgi:hypothetical protein
MTISKLTRMPDDSSARHLRREELQAHPDERRAHAGAALITLLGLGRDHEPYPELRGILNARFAYGERWTAVRADIRQRLVTGQP